MDYCVRIGAAEEPAFFLTFGHVVTAPSTKREAVDSGPKDGNAAKMPILVC